MGAGWQQKKKKTVRDKIATVLDKTSRVHGQDWFVRQTEKTVVRTKKSVVRTKTSVVRTKKTVVRTKKTVKRTVVLPSGRLYMWNGGSIVYGGIPYTSIIVYYCGAKRGTGQNVAHLQIKKNIKGAEEISKYAKY